MKPTFGHRVAVVWFVAVCSFAYVVTTGRGDATANASTDGMPSAGELAALKQRFRRPDSIPHPKANPHSEEKERLGQMLFFDPRLSRSGSVSCGTCHNPSFGWSDGLPKAVGFGMAELPRRTPHVRNLAWGAAFQWDGRAPTLEAQAKMPLTAPDEMNMTMDLVVERLKAVSGYAPLFQAAFEGEDPITARNVTAALATFQRTLVSEVAPFDRWIDGDESAIGTDAKRGFALFTGKAKCSACHSSWRFSDDSFHDIGLKTSEDVGRGKFAPPSVVAMQNAFKTPSLRDLRLQGPYMHDGQLRTIDDVIEHYAKGGEKRPSLSAEMKVVDLTDRERRELVAFLETLNAGSKPVTLPLLP